jgi:integrase
MQSSDLLRTGFHGALRKAGIRQVRFHDLRHSSGSRIIPASDGDVGHFPEDRAIWGALMTA